MSEPYKYHTFVLIDKKLYASYCQTYEFQTRTERDFFASQIKDAIKISKWEIKKGNKGNKKIIYYVSVYTPRNEKESSPCRHNF